ncbi:MAG: hypothetical protein DMF69_22215 [Acidobacteria bacterium]|nr:MAG: hypothetical protein DMF69_22215 [Acidobacteriota bacterium]
MSKQIEHWAAILERITGADFFPEFYRKFISISFLRNWRDRRRRDAVSILPAELFEQTHQITEDDLVIKAEDRKSLWRLYA